MPNLLVRILLFLSSYFPLTAILSVQFWGKGNFLAAKMSLGFGLLGLLGICICFLLYRKMNPVRINISAVSRRDGEAMSYIVSYLLPFLALPTGSAADMISLSIFLSLLAILYVNSDMLHINPMLNLVGWHIYEVTLPDGEIRMLLSRHRIRRRRKISVAQVSDDMFIEVRQ